MVTDKISPDLHK